MTSKLRGGAGFFLLPHPAGVVLVDGTELIEAVVGFDEAVAEVDVDNGRGVDGAVAKVGVSHHIAGETLTWLQLAKSVANYTGNNGPILDSNDRLVHGFRDLMFVATGRVQMYKPVAGPSDGNTCNCIAVRNS